MDRKLSKVLLTSASTLALLAAYPQIADKVEGAVEAQNISVQRDVTVADFVEQSIALPSVAEIKAMDAVELSRTVEDINSTRATYGFLTSAQKRHESVVRWVGYLNRKEDALVAESILLAIELPMVDQVRDLTGSKLDDAEQDIKDVRDLFTILPQTVKDHPSVIKWENYITRKEDAVQVRRFAEFSIELPSEDEILAMTDAEEIAETEELLEEARAIHNALRPSAKGHPSAIRWEGYLTRKEAALAEVKGEVTPEEPTELLVSSVSAINKTTVDVSFNQAVDAVDASHFSIEDARINSATLSEDKTSVRLDVSGLDYDTEYTLVTEGVVVNGAAAEAISTAFTTPAVDALWNLEVVPAKGAIEADGTDNTTVTFQLVDKVTGEVDTDANDIVLDLNTTYGSLAQERATIQNGKATVLLRSEFNANGVTAKIDAQIIEASGDYQDLIGQITGTANVQFVAPGSAEVDAVYLTAANTNEADRVTLTFDNEVSLADFIETDSNGQLTRDLRTDNTVTITQTVGGKNLEVQGFLPGPTANTLIAVLDESVEDGQSVASRVLTDNADVLVTVEMVNSSGQTTESAQEFKFTDARTPQVTSVNPKGMNSLQVKFSEPINNATFRINGRYTEGNGNGFNVLYGTFYFDEITKQFVDERDLATIYLTGAYDQDDIDGYFAAGTHALQVSSIYDYAALSDSNNVGSTQNLAVQIAADEAIATTNVVVDSPNQYRLTFDKVAMLNQENVELQVYNGTTWVAATDAYANFTSTPTVTITPILGDTLPIGQYKVEIEEDWTAIYNTANTNNNYYNDQFRLVIAEDSVTTLSNGKTNSSDIILSLNSAGSAMNQPDVTSPVIEDVEYVGTDENPGRYLVTMSEPITDELAGAVEFIGTDKDGKTRTFEGKSALDETELSNNGYHIDGLDNKFYVTTDYTVTGEDSTQFEQMRQVVRDGGSEEWTLVLKDVTDDIGNKAATVTKDFVITAEELEGKFEVVQYENGDYAVVGSRGDTETITITFTENVSLTGTESAIDVANFALNGADLPTGSSIALDPNPNNNGTIIITVADGTLRDGSNVITLGRNLESKEGTEFTGAYAFTFNVDAMNTTEVSTPGQLLLAIEDAEDGDTIRLTDEIEANVNLTNLVNLDLNGNTLNGSVTIDSETEGTLNISAGTITGDLTVTAPGATVTNEATVNGTIFIEDVADGTWNENASDNKIVFNDKDAGTSFVVATGKTVASLSVAADAKPNVTNNGTITTLDVAEGAEVTIVDGNEPEAITGEGTVKDSDGVVIPK